MSRGISRLVVGLAGVLIAKLLIIAIVSSTTMTSFSAGPALAQADSPASDYVAGQIIVKLHNGKSLDAGFKRQYKLLSAAPLLVEMSTSDESVAAATHAAGLDRLYLVSTLPADFQAVLHELRRDPAVELAEPNYLVHFMSGSFSGPGNPSDSLFADQWALNKIHALDAWRSATGDPSFVVGMIDTGVDHSHPDLQGNILAGVDFSGTRNTDDTSGHGTAVAGALGAVGNNGQGIAGIAWQVSMAPLKIGSNPVYFPNSLSPTDPQSNQEAASIANAVNAIHYADQQHYRVTNNSWAVFQCSAALYDAVKEAQGLGNLFVAAAGNSAENSDCAPSAADSSCNPLYPAAFVYFDATAVTNAVSGETTVNCAPGTGLDNIISVGGTNRNDFPYFATNRGTHAVLLSAPADQITTTTPPSCPGCAGAGQCNSSTTNGYEQDCLNGTSFSSAHVSGAAALLWSSFPRSSYVQIKQHILSCADQLPQLAGFSMTGARLDLGSLFTGVAPQGASLSNPAQCASPLPDQTFSTPVATATSTPTASASASSTAAATGTQFMTASRTATASAMASITSTMTTAATAMASTMTAVPSAMATQTTTAVATVTASNTPFASPTQTLPQGGSVSSSPSNTNASPGQTTQISSFTATNSISSSEAVNSVTVNVSDSHLFSSLTLKGTVNGVSTSVTQVGPGQVTTFTFNPALTVPSDGSIAFTLSGTIAQNPAMLNRGPRYATLIPAGNPGAIALAAVLAVIGIALIGIEPDGKRRRRAMILLWALMLGASVAGCGGQGSKASASRLPPGTAVAFSGIPSNLGTVSAGGFQSTQTLTNISAVSM